MYKHLYLFALVSFILLVFHGTTALAASRVTIYRDTYWVPHIFGNTDEDCAFGMGYAQGEDNLQQIIQNVRQATGTLAEIQGKDYLEHDFFIHLARIPQFAEENYEKIPLKFRSVIEAYCDGVNYYAQIHPEKTPQSWRSLVPQDIVTLGRYISLLVFTGLPGAAFGMIDRYEANKGVGSAELFDGFDEIGSNMWAVSPKKSVSGSTMLVINPHLPWDGLLQWWEVHLRSKEGWNTMGGSFFGAPFIGLGHNEYLGWSHTVNAPDIWDVYRVELNPQNAGQYLYNGNWQDIKVIKEDFAFKEGEEIKFTSRNLEYTHHGPIIRRIGDHAYILKISGWDDVLAIYQWYRMNKARNFHEFKEAMD
ncbi:penicillin acylase family protein, partial [Candidatus Poribacteria bacterium]|nr:penicillin acylase family protein [Candidatus Poribacteria bacterium]